MSERKDSIVMQLFGLQNIEIRATQLCTDYAVVKETKDLDYLASIWYEIGKCFLSKRTNKISEPHFFYNKIATKFS